MNVNIRQADYKDAYYIHHLNSDGLGYNYPLDKTRSLNKAAENLFMVQSNLRPAIKKLEESLCI